MNIGISVALAVYNGETFLHQLLTSLEQQIFKPAEVIILDDCSTDNSLEIIKNFHFSFPRKIYQNEKNTGAIASFKKLVSLCNEDYVAFCDQDDIWLPNKLLISAQEIEKTATNIPCAVFTEMSVIDKNNVITQQSYWQSRNVKPAKFIFKDVLFANIITGCTCIINKALKTEMAKMPLNVCMHDHWIALIAFSFGKHIYINQPTILFRSHQSSVTDKEKISTISVMLNDLKKGKNYLQQNITQAKEFKTLYNSRLSGKSQVTLTRFIKLEKDHFCSEDLKEISEVLLEK